MLGSLDQPPIVVRASRARAAWLVVGSAVFVAIGLFLWEPKDSDVERLLCIGFFGLCGAIGLGTLIVPNRLEIGPTGLTQRVLWRTTRIAWTDAHNFRPAIIGLTNRTVGFDYLTERPKRMALRALNTALAGVQGSLQPGWEIAPQALANLLNDARERWLASEVAPPQTVSSPLSQPGLFAGIAGARINRKTYWLATGIVFAIAITLAYIPGMQRGVGSLTTVLFIRIFASRLHDVGRSGWWQLVLYGAQLPAIILVGAVGGQPISVMVGVGLLIQLIFTFVLGTLPGDREANRFGAPPNQPSPAAISETFR
jgi:uncharacterized membrane protein YhaH (DUF805 family)